ncbi:MAG: hypothetical protein J6C91_09205 [Muribaculaceae bacterium]|nr:hypothetical protein [Muribaculaceae bacterium]
MLWNELKNRNFDVEDAAAILTEHYGIDRALANTARILDRMIASGLLDA